jgi:hypothetical protein
MKTPTGEHAQTGHVHTVRSQLRLLGYLAIQSPQVFLVFLTAIFLVGDLALELRFVPDLVWRALSLRTWVAGNLARLATGAFGANLVALFLCYAEVRQNLRSGRKGTLVGRRLTAYGAFIEWRTD